MFGVMLFLLISSVVYFHQNKQQVVNDNQIIQQEEPFKVCAFTEHDHRVMLTDFRLDDDQSLEKLRLIVKKKSTN